MDSKLISELTNECAALVLMLGCAIICIQLYYEAFEKSFRAVKENDRSYLLWTFFYFGAASYGNALVTVFGGKNQWYGVGHMETLFACVVLLICFLHGADIFERGQIGNLVLLIPMRELLSWFLEQLVREAYMNAGFLEFAQVFFITCLLCRLLLFAGQKREEHINHTAWVLAVKRMGDGENGAYSS